MTPSTEDAVHPVARVGLEIGEAIDPISMTWPQYRRRECAYRGWRVSLSGLETELVAALLLRRGHLVTKLELIEALYPDPWAAPDTDELVMLRTLYRAKHKLPGLIETSHSLGFRARTARELNLARAA